MTSIETIRISPSCNVWSTATNWRIWTRCHLAKPLAVLRAMDDYRNTNANVHRSVHTLSEGRRRSYEGAARTDWPRHQCHGGSGDHTSPLAPRRAINLVGYWLGLDNLHSCPFLPPFQDLSLIQT